MWIRRFFTVLTLIIWGLFFQSCEQKVDLRIGAKAPDFRLKNRTGKKISLRDFKGKIVLLDFWASWCAPCRKNNPLLNHFYKLHKDEKRYKPFEIIDISIDKNQQKWKEALIEDSLQWRTHLIDGLDKSHKTVSDMYQIDYIPTNYLINEAGVILGKNMTHEEISKWLEK